jgi:hypothetical protein
MSVQSGPNLIESGLVLCLDATNRKSYPGSGTTWANLSSNTNSLTLVNSPTFSANGVFSFNGSNQYATTSNNVLNSTAYTKCAWFQTSNLSASNNIISGNSGQHAFWLAGGNKLNSGHNNLWSTVVSNTVLATNQWYFGAVTFNTTTGWALYLNGLLEVTSASTTAFTGTGDVLVAAYGNSNVFQGQINGVFIYNRVLTAQEIQQNFNALRGRFGI